MSVVVKGGGYYGKNCHRLVDKTTETTKLNIKHRYKAIKPW
jgi:hypothetical protein